MRRPFKVARHYTVDTATAGSEFQCVFFFSCDYNLRERKSVAR